MRFAYTVIFALMSDCTFIGRDILATITTLKIQSRNKNRTSVFLDGQFAFGLASAAAAGLKVGQTLSDTEIENLLGRDTIEKGKASAFRLISLRPRSEMEVRRNLAKKGYEVEAIQAVIDSLIASELLNDEQFASYWVEQRETFKPRSKRALRAELLQKGVENSVIDAALSGLDEHQSALAAATNRAWRWQALPQDKFRLKLGQYLQRRGFHYGIIKDVTEELWQIVSEERQTETDYAKE